MCRCGSNILFRWHYVCFACRKTFRQHHYNAEKCPQCAGPLRNMGRDFRAPRASDRKAWEAVRLRYKRWRLGFGQ